MRLGIVIRSVLHVAAVWRINGPLSLSSGSSRGSSRQSFDIWRTVPHSRGRSGPRRYRGKPKSQGGPWRARRAALPIDSLVQQPFLGPLDQQQIRRTSTQSKPPFQLDVVIILVDAWVERLGLPDRFQVFGELPRLEDRLDLSDEFRQFRSELEIVVGRIEEIQKLLSDEICQGLRHAE